MIPPFHQIRISTKIISSLILTAGIGFFTITYVTFTIVNELSLKNQQEKALLLIETIKPSIELSLFLGFDEKHPKLDAITQLEDVKQLLIVDNTGKDLFNYKKKTLMPHESVITVTKTLLEPSSTKSIGIITLVYDNNQFIQVMNRFYYLYGMAAISAILVFWGILLWIKSILRPIKIIARKVHNFRPGEKITFDLPSTQIEFTQIIEAFEAMQDRVWSYAEKFQTINQNLESQVDEQTKQAIRHLYFDSLTSLPNRLKLQEDLMEYPLHTLAILNIDNFKEINDFFGIEEGDRLLIQVAHWLEDLKLHPYRLGSDEFAFKLPNRVSRDDFFRDAELILSMMNEKRFMIGDETVHLSATIGIAIESDKPLIHADVALHKARQERKVCSIYDHLEGIEKQYRKNIEMSAHIRQALVEHRLVCQYQPIVSTKTGKIDKFETLVRIQNEDGTFIGPYEFLPISQKTKLYHHITQEVVYQACHLFMGRTEQFSINLSSSDILDHRTVVTIENILRQTSTAERVIFEILESEGIENFEEVATFISRMKKLGAKIAIDDFGTGYSNFENILKLNVDILKIDGSLIKSINENPKNRIVVEAIVDFANRIGIETVAEFVSTEEILHNITEIGITYSQGYHTGKPQFLNPQLM